MRTRRIRNAHNGCEDDYHELLAICGTTEISTWLTYDIVWRIVVGVSLVPAFGTLYQRLTLPEAKRYTEAQEMTSGNFNPNDSSDTIKKNGGAVDTEKAGGSEPKIEGSRNKQALASAKKSHFAGQHATMGCHLFREVLSSLSRFLPIFLGMAPRKAAHRHVCLLVPPRCCFLWHQLEPERRITANWVRWLGGYSLEPTVQDRYRQHHHYCAWLRPWLLRNCFYH